jgi:site-specific DNA recombinase
MDVVDQAVWHEVSAVLQEPTRLEQEYRRRLLPAASPAERDQTQVQLARLRRGIARLIDSYAEGLIDKAEFEPRITRLRRAVHERGGGGLHAVPPKPRAKREDERHLH